MPNDDFLTQFQQPPPDDFAENLLAQLKQAEQDAVGEAQTEHRQLQHNARQPITLVPHPRTRNRTVDHYLTAVASFIVLLAFASLLILSFGAPNTVDETSTLPLPAAPISTDGLAQIAWTPQGDQLYVADARYLYRLDQNLQLIDSIELDLTGSVTVLVFLDEGALLALGDESGSITLIDTATATIIQTMSVHEGAIQAMTRVTAYDLLLSAGRAGELVILELRAKRLLERNRIDVASDDLPVFVTGLSSHPAGHTIIATLNNAVTMIYDLQVNGVITPVRPDDTLSRMPPTLQATYLPIGDRIAYIWWDHLVVLDTHTLSERYRYPLPDAFQQLYPMQLSDDGLRVLLTNNRNEIGLWDFSHEEYIPIFDISDALAYEVRAALHPDGHRVAAMLPSNEIHLWQLDTASDGQIEVTEVAINRPGVKRQLSDDRDIALAPIALDQQDQWTELFNFGDGFLTQVIWSPDGSQLVVTSTSTVRVYNRQLQLLREWPLVGTDATKVAYTHDGRYLVTASQTGTLTIWDAITGRMVASLVGVYTADPTLLVIIDSRNRIITRDASGAFALLHFDGTALTVVDRFYSAALASYEVLDWSLTEDNLRFVMMRDIARYTTSDNLVNVIDFNLDQSFEAQTTTTAIYGTHSTFAPNSEHLLVYSAVDHQMSIYDSRTFALHQRITVPQSLASAVHMHRDLLTDQIILIDYDFELYRYLPEQQTTLPINDVTGLFDHPSDAIALHPDSQHMAMIASHNHIISGQITAENRFITLADDTPVLGLIQTFITGSDEIAAATTSDGAVLLFNMTTGDLIRRLKLNTWGTRNHEIAFDATGQILVVMGQPLTGFDGILNLIDVQQALAGSNDYHISDSPYHFSREYLSGLSFEQSGQTLITGGTQVRTWDLSTSSVTYRDVDDLSGLLVFAHHPTDSEVATVRPGNYLRVINTDDMRYHYSNPLSNRAVVASTYLTYTPNAETIVLASEGQQPELYDAASGDLWVTLSGLPDAAFNDIALSPEGRLLYAVGDYGMVVWDMARVRRGEIAAQPIPLNFAVQQIAIDANHTRLFLVADDGTVHVIGIPQN